MRWRVFWLEDILSNRLPASIEVMIDVADLHAKYGDVSKFINAMRFDQKLYLYKTQIFNEQFKYIINFYKMTEETNNE